MEAQKLGSSDRLTLAASGELPTNMIYETLGAVLGPLGVVLEPPEPVLEPLGGVLEPLGALLGLLAASWRRRWALRGPKTTQDRPKAAQDGPTTAPRRPQDASWVRYDHRPLDEEATRRGSGSHFGRPGSPGEGGRG